MPNQMRTPLRKSSMAARALQDALRHISHAAEPRAKVKDPLALLVAPEPRVECDLS